MKPFTPRSKRNGAFTIVELLVVSVLIALLLMVLISTTDATRRVWSGTTGRIEQFSESREAFESMTRRLSQATLNTYWDYDDPTKPTRYIRQSELRFISGPAQGLIEGEGTRPAHSVFFQAPLGFSTDANFSKFGNIVNTWGYFLEFGSDEQERPPFIGSLKPPVPLRHRFRLMELMEPAESLSLYQFTSGEDSSGKRKNNSYLGHEWFQQPLQLSGTARPARVLAENVLALILLPKLSVQEDATTSRLAPKYSYDSTTSHPDPNINPKNQLPPVIQVTLVSAEEASFSRLQSGNIPPDFGLEELFKDASKYYEDMRQLETTLAGRKLNYRIFSTNVSLRGAKWSRGQKN
jgi:uncharacterized protein (TIGR02599 family)